MNATPILSLCIPSYQKARWLDYGLGIALEQAKELNGLVEIVVSDNASEDETPAVLEKYKTLYGDLLIVHRNSTNIGLISNCKKVVELAHGRYCWIIGNNDVLESNALNFAVQALQKNSQISYFFCNYSYFRQKETPQGTPELKKNSAPIAKDLSSHPVGKIRDLVHLDCGVFTPLYSSIMLREHWLQAMETYLKGTDPFSSVASSVPHALYVIEHLLEQPGYYIGNPLLKVSDVISWDAHFPYYELCCLPTLYQLLEQKGMDPEIFKKHRQTILSCSGNCFLAAIKTPDLLKKHEFSLVFYIAQNWKTAFFWQIVGESVRFFWEAPLRNFREITHCPNWGEICLFTKKIITEKHYNTLKKIKNHLFGKKNLPTGTQ